MTHKIDFKKELNESQYQVATGGDGPCLVLAGAGSGKTRTITYRVAYLLEQGVDPNSILLVTFTNKAAKEMIGRVGALTSRVGKLPWSGTFHHVAYRILVKYAPLLGYNQKFSILDSEDSRDLIKMCVKGEGMDGMGSRFPSARVIVGLISYSKNASRLLSSVVSEKYPKWIDLVPTLENIASAYDKRKKEAQVMDFDDLLINLQLLLIKSDSVRKRYSEQFKYVLVDEYQDTNVIQAKIMDLFSSFHKNILVVGDDAQSIYSFRAADINNILSFEKKYPNARVFRLETNYRSTPEILNLANDVIGQNTDQYEKELKSILSSFSRPELTAFADMTEEAEYIGDRILELIDEGVSLNQIAVLFRASHHSQALEMELNKRDIPYEYRGGIRFFERAHIKDVLAYLRIYSNYQDAIAWSRVLNMQSGVGPAIARKIFDFIKEYGVEGIGVVSDNLPARAKIGWNDFLSIWKAASASDGTASGLIRAIIKSKYSQYLEYKHTDYRDRLRDLEQLALFAEGKKDLSKFLAEASMQESYAASKDQGEDDSDQKMVLSTVHQAKGLEWEAVFVINLAKGQFPNERAVRESKGLEEERRLFYVAITRAKKYLTMSYPLTGGFGGYLQGPSMFIEQLNTNLISGGFDNEITSFDNDLDDLGDDTQGITYEPLDKPVRTSFLKSIDEL